MKNKLILTFGLFLTFESFAQNSNLDFRHSIKLYNLSSFTTGSEKTVGDVTIHKSSSLLQVFAPTIAYALTTKKKNFHEIELNGFAFNQQMDATRVQEGNVEFAPISGAMVITSKFSMRYEFIMNLFKKSQSPLITSLGFAFNPYFNSVKTEPANSNSFPTKTQIIGGRGFLIPRLTYHVKSKCYFDLNLPIALFQAENKAYTVENPMYRAQQQKTKSSSLEALPSFLSLRIGVGVKI